MAHYQTEQKKVLLAFLKSHKEQAFSIDDLCEAMKEEVPEDSLPGKSTIYRLMPELLEEGLVKRFVKEHSRKFLYQMIGGEHCHHHLHFKCSICGKVVHMKEQESEAFLLQVLKNYGFLIDEGKTILFGSCKQCESVKG